MTVKATQSVFIVELRENYPGVDYEDCTVMHVASTLEGAVAWAQSDESTRELSLLSIPSLYCISEDEVDGNILGTKVLGFVGKDGGFTEDQPPEYFLN